VQLVVNERQERVDDLAISTGQVGKQPGNISGRHSTILAHPRGTVSDGVPVADLATPS